MLMGRITSRYSDHVPTGGTRGWRDSRSRRDRPPPAPTAALGPALPTNLLEPPPEQLRWAPEVKSSSSMGSGAAARAFQPLLDDAQMFVSGIIIQVHFCSNQRALGSGVNRLTKPVLHSG